jgi:hypothetical protein
LPLIDDESGSNDVDSNIFGIKDKPNWNHTIDNTRRSLSAATIQNVRTLLTTEQLKDCAEAYTNCGFLRSVIDKNIFFMIGERTRFQIVPNNELVEGREDKEIKELEKNIADNDKYKALRTDILRLNKRVELQDRLNKLLTGVWVFGRAFLQVERLKPDDPESTMTTKFDVEGSLGARQYGEPVALKPLIPYRIEKTLVDDKKYTFEGILYNYGVNANKRIQGDRGKKVIKPENLIAAWYDDNTVFDNTYYSGISPTWSVLSAAQTIEIALDKNIPEFLMAVAQGFGQIYTGTNKKSVAEDIKNTIQHSTWFIHNYKDLKMEAVNLARNPEELTNIIAGLCRYICQSMNLPIFLAFEDTTNFATANQVMQSYKVSTLARHRTWLQGVLEKYWYDPILADFFGVPVEDVISQEIKIKPIFDDINFETKLEIIQGEDILMRNGVHNPIDAAKSINDKEAQRRLEQEDALVQEQERMAIEKTPEGTKEVPTGQPANPNLGFKSRKQDAQPT